ncbi:hypothetical protein EZJ43_12865 [Pedobacter changchengzhani]|uniref:tRNA (Guanine-N1)-methyltransferase n=1 Tax=Pedobacter changchengzhani TaxID=2529274 RepID=A0A4R5MIX6_9SPHI|nr:hypothetical protein [Pedobacter changchengzhani]TDG35510.1 hypothetical protein EZJ43_12865 [Pedobacter changchengzhani]
MKLKPILYCAFIAFFFNLSFAHAQIDSTKNTDASLNGQFQYLLSSSRNSWGSKLINPIRLNALWKSVNDTLQKERKELKSLKSELKAQTANIAALKLEVAGKESSLADSHAKVDEIGFLGIQLSKTAYNLAVWTIIIVLGLGLAIVIFGTARYKKEAVYRTDLYQEVADEFQAYKVKAKERQMKLTRELQDERNKWDEANGR